jgi:hypothetical protein
LTQTLDTVFDSYDRRKQSEMETALDEAAKAKIENEEGRRALKDRVLPALRVMEGAIVAKGHKVKVTEKLADAYPSVSLDFTPEQRAKGPPFHVPSRIAFTFYGGAMEAKPEIALSAPQVASKMTLSGLSSEWVTQEVIAMIRAALAKA